MSSQPASALVLSGISCDGVPLIQGVVICPEAFNPDSVTTAPTFHHVESFKDFQVEEWSGEHGAHEDEEHHAVPEVPSVEIAHEDDRHDLIDENTPVASSAQFERPRSDSLAAAILEVAPQETKPFVGFVQPIEEEGGNGHDEEKTEFLRAPLLAEPCSGSVSPMPPPSPSPDCNKLPDFSAAMTADNSGSAPNTSLLLSNILIGLSQLQMTSPEKYTAAVNRLQQLEEELKQAGAICPKDFQLSSNVAKALAAGSGNSDVQIRVSTSRKTTTTNTSYETETPGMCGLDQEQVSKLHKEMLANLSLFA